jgi:hypothetical protein
MDKPHGKPAHSADEHRLYNELDNVELWRHDLTCQKNHEEHQPNRQPPSFRSHRHPNSPAVNAPAAQDPAISPVVDVSPLRIVSVLSASAPPAQPPTATVRAVAATNPTPVVPRATVTPRPTATMAAVVAAPITFPRSRLSCSCPLDVDPGALVVVVGSACRTGTSQHPWRGPGGWLPIPSKEYFDL